MTDENLKDLIIANLDVTDFLDILELDIADLVELLSDEISENRAALWKAVE